MMLFIKIVLGVFVGIVAASATLFGLATSKKVMKWYLDKYMGVIDEVTGDLVDKL